MTIHYLGSERYGMWMTLSSSAMLLTFADLGIGNGLLNAVSQSTGREDRDSVQAYVSSAFFLLLVIAALLLALFALTYNLIPWQSVFNVRSPVAVREIGPAVAVFFACFCFALPFGVAQRVHLGLQEGVSNNLWVMAGNFLGLLGILFAVKREAGLPWLALALSGAPVVALVLNGAVLFRSRPWLTPKWSKSSAKHMRELLKLGLSFLVLQTCVVFVSAIDNLIVAQHMGSAAVTQYAVPMRMFSALPALVIMALNPLWPAYGESIARGEVQWARIALTRSLRLILFVTVAVGSVLVVFGPDILNIWVRGEVQVTRPLLAGMALWMLLSSAANAVSIFLNGANLVRVQVYSAVAMCAGATILKLSLIDHFGLVAVIWSTDVSYLFFVWIPIVFFIPRYLLKLDRDIATSSTVLRVASAS
jgi:O-antigen/teichoic acid export membrane protein